jgi:hypothetical protein
MEDLSHLASLTGGCSMGAVNTVSPAPMFGAPGSVSESVTEADILGAPGPAIPAQRARTVVTPSAAPRYTSPWSRADGSPWVSASDESSPGDAPAGPWDQS